MQQILSPLRKAIEEYNMIEEGDVPLFIECNHTKEIVFDIRNEKIQLNGR